MTQAVSGQEITTIETTDEMGGHAEARLTSSLDRLAEHLG